MKFSVSNLFAFSCAVLSVRAEVVVLTEKSFEHLTQASTGATTGDWFVKFYAPWCGHCKTLEPTWHELSDELEGTVNIAKVDVPANPSLGSRFDIKGFPTLKLFHKGEIYDYSGPRNKAALAEFARGGYLKAEAQKVPEPRGPFAIFEDIPKMYKLAYEQAMKDFNNKKYFTVEVGLFIFPIFFLIVFLYLCLAPIPEEPVKPSKKTE